MIPRIVITGGPCGGKTTAVEFLKQELPKHDWKPIVVPEIATLLYTAGIRWTDMATEKYQYEFQTNIIRQQIAHEDTFYSFAHLVPGRKVFICDRGTIDNMAYAPDRWHEDILSQVGSLGYLKRRYDGIIHLQTLAYGDGYTTENNEARYESRAEAMMTDSRTWEMWARGPRVPQVLIKHSDDLQTKLDQVLSHVLLACEYGDATQAA